ncbi:hypothetical protein EJ05DRAFT_298776 [Pseudovirgaria hyperparasitica]|uniref:Tcp11-domain-containing protein n=1 Tax=Pseudovirgaria hyperparasitica TaxID=470096 RepID=A0A6A6WBX6_9PEZI|nr:uncharacterized protein EJ05DRAFT_298776 [Pseudovirgaria hyperparasitica]KAF2759460.1 hypothetical protein EJ05DRAFT_298776 [Pseudovirgaria hyperparasitica]
MNQKARQRSPRGNSVHREASVEHSPRRQCREPSPVGSSSSPMRRDGQCTRHPVTRKGSGGRSRKKQERRRRANSPPDRNSIQDEGRLPWTDYLCGEMTDNQVLAQLGRIIDEEGPKRTSTDIGVTLGSCFVAVGGLHPPITKKSLSELDINAIIVNPKLRHDVNFDRELHFRPNLDGDRGKEKIREAERYWLALEAELELYNILFQRAVIEREPIWLPRCTKMSMRRVPIMFETIRDILQNLVPERDQARIEEQLDQQMLMQQIGKGLCDLVSLSQWLSHLLKAHCAPMRDVWVDKMVQQTKKGVEEGSAKCIVDGLRELLGILEAMKLDVANHQIRHLRALLIDDTVNFERKYQVNRIPIPKKINAAECRAWYARAQKGHQYGLPPSATLYPRAPRLATSQPHFVAFYRALLHHLLVECPASRPDSFYLDTERLRIIQSELHNQVYFDLCCAVFQVIIDDIVKCCLNSQPVVQHLSLSALRTALLTIISGVGEATKQWQKNIPNLAVEIVRHALAACGFTKQYDAGLVTIAEQLLTEKFGSHFPNYFELQALKLMGDFFPVCLEIAERHISASPIDLFNALIAPSSLPLMVVPPPPPPPVVSSKHALQHSAKAASHASSQRNLPLSLLPSPVQPSTAPPHLIDIARRLTHIAILHWQVWAPILYLKIDEPELPSLSSNNASSTTSSCASTPISSQATHTFPLAVRTRSATVDAHTLQAPASASASDVDSSKPLRTPGVTTDAANMASGPGEPGENAHHTHQQLLPE